MAIAAGQDALASDVNARLVPIGGIVAWLKTFAQRATGTNTSVSANKLIDSGATFQTAGVAVGDVVENNTDGTFSYVTAIDSQTQLSLNNDIFTGTSKTYYVWKTPKLEAGWVECNGQTISDADSPYNSVAAPNLNNTAGPDTQRFLRGAKRSGATGGEDEHTLTTSEIPAHTHTVKGNDNSGGTSPYLIGLDTAETDGSTGSTGGGAAHQNRPPYYEVVWVMRIK
jgi:microcystin-dependent protein